MIDKQSSPERIEPADWEHYELWKKVKEAILALPGHFKSVTNIEGMLATDIFTLNAALGATIEEQVVATLNQLRPVWDPDRRYQAYSFVRQPQTFPDVLLRKKTDGEEILLGVELKGWYILAKEGMPNFRFTVSAEACNPWDLIVVVPWVLSNVLSGSPEVHPVFIDLARFAAEQRNYYWKYERETQEDRGIEFAKGVGPYPAKADKISDRPKSDRGGNFGRLARYGIMSEYVKQTMLARIRGISAREWLAFFRKHAKE
ncbi:MAG: hypothetical protein ACE5JS_08300 [Nitrospinota bacterium]